jgi:hypothetical protein
MAQEYFDEVFGRLIRHEGTDWYGSFDSMIFGEGFEYTVESNPADPERLPGKEQKEAFLAFRCSEHELRSRIEKAIFDHYRGIVDDLRRAWHGEADERAPKLDCPSQIWRLLGNPQLTVGAEDTGIWVFFSAHWDPEHGITAFLEGSRVAAVQ